MKKVYPYPHGAIKAILLAGLTTFVVALLLAYVFNPKPFNELLNIIFNE